MTTRRWSSSTICSRSSCKNILLWYTHINKCAPVCSVVACCTYYTLYIIWCLDISVFIVLVATEKKEDRQLPKRGWHVHESCPRSSRQKRMRTRACSPAFWIWRRTPALQLSTRGMASAETLSASILLRSYKGAGYTAACMHDGSFHSAHAHASTREVASCPMRACKNQPCLQGRMH